MPTQQQMITAMTTLQSLSNFYRPIYLFRYDDRSKEIFILAGDRENVEITIFDDGRRSYEVYE
jgi:hypothetical protein